MHDTETSVALEKETVIRNKEGLHFRPIMQFVDVAARFSAQVTVHCETQDADGTSPISYEGKGSLPTRGLYDTIDSWDVNCQYANGVKMRFMGHRVARPVVMKYRKRWCDHGTTFHGAKGWVSVDRGGIYASDPKLLKVQIRADEIHLIASRGQDRNFLDSVRSRKATVNPVESAIRSDTISHISDILIRTGRPMKWDPKKEDFINDEQASRMLHRTLRAPWKL